MRITSFAAILLATLLVTSTASAQEARASVQGFGGVGLGSFTTVNTNFGGVISGDLTPNIQVIGEVGRLSNILPTMTETLSTPSGSLRPYAEASGGIARLTPHVSGLDGLPGAFTNAGLAFLNNTAPIATLGLGFTVNAGNFVADAGYRYHQVFSDSWMQALALGDRLGTNEVRFGIGVRF
jgi:opacity protein-like surface antigen